jgi:L,D-peptidoglycan transpeptidase YkuD (ErfK/YbiS/YcfS/YnhG family)
VKSGTVPRRAGIGSLIEIHGDGGQGRDWTDGCVALDNRDMDRVFARASVGTTVTIVGTF